MKSVNLCLTVPSCVSVSQIHRHCLGLCLCLVRVYVCVCVSVSVCHLEITRVDICLLRSDTYLTIVLIRHNIPSHLRSFSG